MQTAVRDRLTHQEYFDLEQETGEKYEYFHGEVFAMAGGSLNHAALQSSVTVAVGSRLRGRSCRPYSSDLRVYVEAFDLYTYPDLSVVCGPALQRDEHVLLNPTLLVEILSPSTEAYDRGEKFAMYQRLESLQQYVLVAQDRHRVELFTRRPDGSWTYEAFNGIDATVPLHSIDCVLPLGELYESIEVVSRPLHSRG